MMGLKWRSHILVSALNSRWHNPQVSATTLQVSVEAQTVNPAFTGVPAARLWVPAPAQQTAGHLATAQHNC